ncbi:MAG: alpha/beta fold hydrolase [Polyangiaceae bacterium]
MASGLFFPGATSRYDFIAIDWRGVGESGQIQCDITEPDAAFRTLPLRPGPGAERQAYAELFARYQSSCEDGYGGALFANMGTEQAARDMDRVREALGEEKISYLGISYGGYLGAVYATLFPDRVHAFVLDSPASPTPDVLTDLESWATRIEPFYDAFFTACGGDAGCAFHGGEGASAVALAYETLMAELEASGGLTVGSRTLTRSDAGKALYGRMLSQNVNVIASELADLEAGDGTALLADADGWYAGSSPDLMDVQVIFCLDRSANSIGTDPFWDGLAALESGAAPHVAYDIANYWGMCRDWPVVRPPTPVAAATAPPLLVITGDTDMWAPRPYAEATVDALGNGSHLLVGDHFGHGQTTFTTPSMCAPNTADAFFEDPTVAPTVTDCGAM